MKRTLVLLTTLFAVAFGLYSLSNSRTFQLFGDIVHRVETNDKVVALTFDDGPWNKQLPEDVLAILDKHNVKGTFYLNGRGIRDNMRTTQQIVAQGHEIGNHGFTHKRLVFKSINTIEREITETYHLIREAGYQGKMTFRPPYFKKLFVLPYYLNKHDIVTVTGDVEADNDLFATSDEIVNSVLTETRPGSIVLLHVLNGSRNQSRAALPGIIRGLKAKGYSFVTVSELLSRQS